MRRAIKLIGIVCVAITLSIRAAPALSDTLYEQIWAGIAAGPASISGFNELSVADDFTVSCNCYIANITI